MKKVIAMLLTALMLTPFGSQPQITDNEEQTAMIEIDENQSFTAKLMQSMDENENYFISPFSIKTALAMAANGADGVTRDEIIKTADIGDLKEYNSTVLDIITRYGKGGSIKLDVADSIWINESRNGGRQFTDSFKSLVEKYYNGTSETVTDSDAVKRVNQWVSDNTNGKIKDIISDSDFGALLANAVYFKGAWRTEFHEANTSEDDFTNKNGNVSRTEFMNITDDFNYYADENVKVIELPYTYEEDKDVSMFLILPKEGYEYDIEELLSGVELQNVSVKLKMPKFKTESFMSLKETLINLGMTDSFNPDKADFSKMFTDGGMFIDEILHKTYIDVDEKGTEAAAVTVIMMKMTSMPFKPSEPEEFIADRPFAYCIRENI